MFNSKWQQKKTYRKEEWENAAKKKWNEWNIKGTHTVHTTHSSQRKKSRENNRNELSREQTAVQHQ